MSADANNDVKETRHAVPARDIYVCPHCREETHKTPFGTWWRCPECRSRVFADEVPQRGEGWL